jgi:hypothetical protein
MSIVRVPDAALVDQAELVVVGEVVGRGPAAGGGAATEYRVRVEQALKGAAGGELVVRVPGGISAAGLGLEIFGAPRFAAGERALLFLEARADGSHRILHLVQGAFHEVRVDGATYAVRNLADVQEVRLVEGEVEAAPAATREPVRDFDAFTRWVAARGRGARAAADYLAAAPSAAVGGLGSVTGSFTLFRDPDDSRNMRWFQFDGGSSVPWRFHTSGQSGVSGGGQNQFKAALQSWNAESQTPINLTYAGTTNASGGLACDECSDDLNVILFGDPNDELTDLSPLCSGTLAYGGPWYTLSTLAFNGKQYHRIVEGDIVINNGLECFFGGSPNASKAAEELFAHELGHTLGIDHACGDSDSPACNSSAALDDALMRAFIHDDSRGGTLKSDDMAAARALYKQPAGPGPTAPAAPAGLVADAVSTTQIALHWTDNSNNETGFAVEIAALGGTFQVISSVGAGVTTAAVQGLAPASGYVFRVRAFNATGSSGYSGEAQASTNALPGPCVPGDNTHCLNGGRFRVEVLWTDYTDGSSGPGHIVPGVASDDSGLFYFFQPQNWEMLVKVLNACVPELGNSYWVFFAATTDVEFTLRVTDTVTTATKNYHNPPHHPADAVTDSGALAVCP